MEKSRVGRLIWPALAFLASFYLVPTLRTLALSVTEPRPGAENFLHILRAPVYLEILGNTFVIAAQVAAICLLLAYPTALFIVARRRAVADILMALVIVPFFTSLLVRNYAWVFLLGAQGAVNRMLQGLGLARQSLMYNRFGVIVGMTDILLPYAVLILVNVLRGLDPLVLRAAVSLGSGPFSLLRCVVLPLSRSGIAASFILVFVIGLAFFVTPAMLGSPHETMIANTISTEVGFLNWGFATALAILLLVATLLIVSLMQAVFGNLSTIAPSLGGGRPPRAWSVRLLPDRAMTALDRVLDRVWPAACAMTASIVLALLILPILFIIPLSLTSVDYFVFPPPGYSLRWYASFFTDERWMAATGNSLVVAGLTACLTLAIAVPAALAIARTRSRLVSAAYLLILSPLIVPTIITAISLYFFFIRIGLTRSIAGLVLGHTVGALPIAVVVLVTAFSDFDWTLERAALSLGSSRFDAARRVVLPLVLGALVTAAFLAFLSSFDDLLVALFVGGIRLETLPRLMWESLQEINPTIAAASTVVTLFVAGLLGVLQLLRGRLARRFARSAT